MKKKTISVFLVIMMLFFGVSLSLKPQSVLVPFPKITHPIDAQKVQFIISSWAYPDEYGQGIAGFFIRDNHTGVFLGGAQPWGSAIYDNNSDAVFEMNYTANTALELDVRIVLNLTLVGLTYPSDNALGINYFRLGITFSGFENYNFAEWSQQNFTYDYLSGDMGDDLWYYSEEVIINHLIVAGAVYTITIDYEVYYEGAEGDFDYDVELASDIDDDWWRTDTGPTHYIDTTTVNCRWSVGFAYEGQMRFQLNIPKDAIITSATVTMYDSLDSGPTSDGKIWRIDEDNVGSLEADSSFPAVDDSEYASITWDGLTGWDTYTITDLVQTQVNLSGWSSGNYIGLRFNFTTSATSNNVGWYDFEHANDYHPYLNVTYTAPVIDWNIVSTASLFFSVPLDYWALNMSLVFGGLIIMLVSVCLIAVKVRDRTITQDAGILLFFLFCVGWGLFIGGTLIG